MRLANRFVTTTVVLLFALIATAGADCYIGGSSSAEANPDDPAWGAWKYTLEITWDNSDAGHGLSHLDVLFGPEAQICCDPSYFTLPDSAGYSDGDPNDCVVPYYLLLECAGDPSIPGDEGALLKFEPIEDDCEPGVTGTGVFFFYSDFAPLPVPEPNEYLIFKASEDACYGTLTGVMPLDCEPVSAESTDWSTIKVSF